MTHYPRNDTRLTNHGVHSKQQSAIVLATRLREPAGWLMTIRSGISNPGNLTQHKRAPSFSSRVRGAHMKSALLHFAWLAMLIGQVAWSQTGHPQDTPVAPATPPVEDFKPASTNQPGRQYPQVNSEGRVRARISAPEAHSVFLDINGIK